jgi:hypothetical protein
MLTKADRRAQYKVMERLRETRMDNLRLLRDQYGSWRSLAKRLGTTDQFLNHLAGPNPRRDMGEKTARGFETTLALPMGWFDAPHPKPRPAPLEGFDISSIA